MARQDIGKTRIPLRFALAELAAGEFIAVILSLVTLTVAEFTSGEKKKTLIFMSVAIFIFSSIIAVGRSIWKYFKVKSIENNIFDSKI